MSREDELHYPVDSPAGLTLEQANEIRSKIQITESHLRSLQKLLAHAEGKDLSKNLQKQSCLKDPHVGCFSLSKLKRTLVTLPDSALVVIKMKFSGEHYFYEDLKDLLFLEGKLVLVPAKKN